MTQVQQDIPVKSAVQTYGLHESLGHLHQTRQSIHVAAFFFHGEAILLEKPSSDGAWTLPSVAHQYSGVSPGILQALGQIVARSNLTCRNFSAAIGYVPPEDDSQLFAVSKARVYGFERIPTNMRWVSSIEGLLALQPVNPMVLAMVKIVMPGSLAWKQVGGDTAKQ